LRKSNLAQRLPVCIDARDWHRQAEALFAGARVEICYWERVVDLDRQIRTVLSIFV
jgi:hypothetical protein